MASSVPTRRWPRPAESWGRLVARHRFALIAGWALVVAGAAMLAAAPPRLPSPTGFEALPGRDGRTVALLVQSSAPPDRYVDLGRRAAEIAHRGPAQVVVGGPVPSTTTSSPTPSTTSSSPGSSRSRSPCSSSCSSSAAWSRGCSPSSPAWPAGPPRSPCSACVDGVDSMPHLTASAVSRSPPGSASTGPLASAPARIHRRAGRATLVPAGTAPRRDAAWHPRHRGGRAPLAAAYDVRAQMSSSLDARPGLPRRRARP